MITTRSPHQNTSGPTVERMVIAPDMALNWLETANTNNRKVSEKYVHRLARDMAEDKWYFTHAGIAFDSDGTLLDGQHRLWAIVESGIAIDMIVWRNIDPKAMMAIDCGKARSMSDILNIAGENGEVNNYRLAVLRAMLGGFGSPSILSPSEASKLLLRHHDAIEFAITNLPMVTSARGVNTAMTRAVVARAYYSVETMFLKDFCRKLTTGILTSEDERVVVLLRQQLLSMRGSSYGQRMQRYGKVERALSAWLKGENPARLYPASRTVPLAGRGGRVKLREYQQEAVDAVYRHLRERDDNPAIVQPTAAGKSWIIAQLASDAVLRWGGRVLVLAHVKELLDQNAEKIRLLCPKLDVGIYSAGLKRRDTKHAVIVAGIQSVFRRACELDAFDLIVIDECHRIAPDGEGMFQKFLADAKVVNPNVRLIGLTATPFRMKSGMICGPDNLLNAICHEVGIKELITQGYLCPLVSKAGVHKPDTSGLRVRYGEFIAGDVEDLMDQGELVDAACREIVTQTVDRKSCLIFASGVAHAKHVQAVLQGKYGVECGLVTGDTPPGEREETLARFRGEVVPADLFGDPKPPLKYLVNVDVLTTGFDSPGIDTIGLLRPTMSAGLLIQMVGRGFRLHPDKKDCLVLDFGGNILRHGPIDQIAAAGDGAPRGGDAPAKECPQCRAVIAAGYAVCPDCGHQFPPPDRQKHEAEASREGILSGQVTDTRYDVRDVRYAVHTKKGADEDAPKTMRVDYSISLFDTKSEWVCFEHEGFARSKAVKWWRMRSNDPIPSTAQLAVDIANAGGVAPTEAITVRSVAGEKFDTIIKHELGEKPEPLPVHAAMGYSDADIPF